MRRARADLHVVGLQERAALLAPVLLQAQDDLLKGDHRCFGGGAGGRDNFLKLRILPVSSAALRRVQRRGDATARATATTAGQSPKRR